MNPTWQTDERAWLAALPGVMAYETNESGMKGYAPFMDALTAHRAASAGPDALLAGGPEASAAYAKTLADVLAAMSDQLYDEYRTVESYLKTTALALLAMAERGELPGGAAADLRQALLTGIGLRAIPQKLKTRAEAL